MTSGGAGVPLTDSAGVSAGRLSSDVCDPFNSHRARAGGGSVASMTIVSLASSVTSVIWTSGTSAAGSRWVTQAFIAAVYTISILFRCQRMNLLALHIQLRAGH